MSALDVCVSPSHLLGKISWVENTIHSRLFAYLLCSMLACLFPLSHPFISHLLPFTSLPHRNSSIYSPPCSTLHTTITPLLVIPSASPSLSSCSQLHPVYSTALPHSQRNQAPSTVAYVCLSGFHIYSDVWRCGKFKYGLE